MVIAGGLATRFHPVSRVIPKPLLPLGTKSVIDYVADSLEGFEIWLMTNSYLAPYQVWADIRGVKVYVSPAGDSPELGGVAADLYHLSESMFGFEDVLLSWGNMVYTGDVKAFVNHYRGKPLLGLYDVKDLELMKRYGAAEIDGKNLVSYEEKPEEPKTTLTYMGLAVIPTYVLKLIPEFLQFVGRRHHRFGEFLNWLVKVKGLEVNTVLVEGDWFYLDWPDSYERLWRWYLEKKVN